MKLQIFKPTGLSAEQFAYIKQALGRVEAMLYQVLKGEQAEMIDFTKMIQAVNDETTTEASVETALTLMTRQYQELSIQLATALANSDPAAAATVQAQLDQLTAQIQANTGKLAAAVAANTTPPAPVPAPVPAPPQPAAA